MSREPGILITGASSGIGAATALVAAERGHALILLDRDEQLLAAVCERARSAGAASVTAAAVDVTDPHRLASVIDAAVHEAGVVRGAVCCAGIDRGGASHELAVDVWDLVLATNLRGTFLTCQAVIRHLLGAGQPGAIVCVSSVLASVATPGGSAAYCASKGGVAALVRSLAVEYADRGIRVNALAPGATETPLMWAPVAPDAVAAMRDQVNREVPLGRLADPAEQGRAALWLLSDEASYMTGSQLVLDGGVLARASLSV
jgi:NAD(P)-dependent dehydrogenase (short-subunit alcohol dehydrogenase family)